MLQAPEVLRVPLEELVLQIHLLGLGPAAAFVARLIEPPPARSVEGALAQLRAIKALDADERLTPLGARPSRLLRICSLFLCVDNFGVLFLEPVTCSGLFDLWDSNKHRQAEEINHSVLGQRAGCANSAVAFLNLQRIVR